MMIYDVSDDDVESCFGLIWGIQNSIVFLGALFVCFEGRVWMCFF